MLVLKQKNIYYTCTNAVADLGWNIQDIHFQINVLFREQPKQTQTNLTGEATMGCKMCQRGSGAAADGLNVLVSHLIGGEIYHLPLMTVENKPK